MTVKQLNRKLGLSDADLKEIREAVAKAEDKKVAQFRMTDAEFASMVGIMSTVKSSFEKMIFKTQYEIAEANSYKHKEKK